MCVDQQQIVCRSLSLCLNHSQIDQSRTKESRVARVSRTDQYGRHGDIVLVVLLFEYQLDSFFCLLFILSQTSSFEPLEWLVDESATHHSHLSMFSFRLANHHSLFCRSLEWHLVLIIREKRTNERTREIRRHAWKYLQWLLIEVIVSSLRRKQNPTHLNIKRDVLLISERESAENWLSRRCVDELYRE